MIELKQEKLLGLPSIPFEVGQTLIGHPDHKQLAEDINNGIVTSEN